MFLRSARSAVDGWATMSSPRSTLIGGPWDGGTLTPTQDAPFVWVGMVGTGARCYALPAEGRHLYRLVKHDRPYEYLYAGHTHGHCTDCGGYTEITSPKRPLGAPCDFCGEPLSRS